MIFKSYLRDDHIVAIISCLASGVEEHLMAWHQGLGIGLHPTYDS